jgi:hypothetical protein
MRTLELPGNVRLAGVDGQLLSRKAQEMLIESLTYFGWMVGFSVAEGFYSEE